MKKYYLGTFINQIRVEKNISKDKLCYGLCSVVKLSKIENSFKKTDLILVKALLERMGKHSEEFMYILDDNDFELFEKSVYIKKYIKEHEYDLALKELKKYEEKIKTNKNIYYQFIYKCKALIQRKSGNIEKAHNLYKIALEYTLPNFEKIRLDDYLLSNIEMDIVLEYMDTLEEV